MENNADFHLNSHYEHSYIIGFRLVQPMGGGFGDRQVIIRIMISGRHWDVE